MAEVRYIPDYSDIEGAHVYLQWKGTHACLDFHCECGAHCHYDGYNAQALRCGACGREWALPHTFSAIPLPQPCAVAPVDTEVVSRG